MAENRLVGLHRGYVIVLLGFFIVVLGSAGNMTFGVFFEPLLNEFGWTRAMTSGAISISGFIAGMFNILTGRLTDRFGPRLVTTIAGCFSGIGLILLSQITAVWQLYLCFGIIAIGGSGFLIPIVSTVSRWFVKRRGTMTSIVISALGTCEMTMPHLARWLIAGFGWRDAYIVLGLLVMVVIGVSAQFIKRDPGEATEMPRGDVPATQPGVNLQMSGLSLQESMRTREFWIFITILLCYFFGQSFFATHVVILGTGAGISRVSAANILVIVGAMYILSLNVAGNTIDRIGKRPSIAIGFLMQSAALLLLITAREVWAFYLCAIILGLGRGSAMAPMPLLIADKFGLKSFGVIQGAIFFGATAGNIIGPVLTGHIFDLTGSYTNALLACGSVAFVGMLLTIPIRVTTGAHVPARQTG